jgi:hypothetical protein
LRLPLLSYPLSIIFGSPGPVLESILPWNYSPPSQLQTRGIPPSALLEPCPSSSDKTIDTLCCASGSNTYAFLIGKIMPCFFSQSQGRTPLHDLGHRDPKFLFGDYSPSGNAGFLSTTVSTHCGGSYRHAVITITSHAIRPTTASTEKPMSTTDSRQVIFGTHHFCNVHGNSVMT